MGLLAVLLALAAGPAQAQDAPPVTPPVTPGTTLALDAGHASLELRAYAMGVLPLDGRFTAFDGTLSITPPRPPVPGQCRIVLQVPVASLRMDDSAIGRDMLSPDLLDAARYPMMRFDGGCSGAGGVVGMLELHGVQAPLTLAVAHRGDLYTAEARLRRADWGVVGRPALAGPTVRIRLRLRLPRLDPELPAGLPGD